MKKTLISALIVGLLPVAAFAQSVSQDNMANKYFAPDTVKLTPAQKRAIAIGEKWANGEEGAGAFPGPDGSIMFNAEGQTTVVCAVLQVCDVALQAGESVNTLNVGDPRFTVNPAISGTGTAQTEHMVLKALDVGLDTTLMVATNRRTYHLRLISTRDRSMPYVHFNYPEDLQAKWAAVQLAQTKERQENTIPSTGEYLGNLNFDYTIEGSTRWKPTRVYNDGRKTIIEMPEAMQQSEAPTLLVVNKDAGIFTSAKTQMVNYRLQGNRYVVDTIFNKAILISGVGSDQEKVTIVRGGAK